MRALLLVAFVAVACGSPRAGEGPPRPPRATPGAPSLPAEAGAFAPSFADVKDGRADRLTRGGSPGLAAALEIDDVETCGHCHADVIQQWRSSAHAFASFNNPIYRLSIDRFRAERGAAASRFCGGCHDVALLFDGALSSEEPISAADPRAHAGVTCRTCHGVVETRPDGNGSYTITHEPIPIPKTGDAASLRAHLDRVALKPLRTADLCVSCHRVFLDPASGNTHHLFGQDDATPWVRSAFAGNQAHLFDDEDVPERDCRGCHMPLEDAVAGDVAATGGKIASHRFLGGHTWLHAMRGDAATLARNQAFLFGSVSIDVAAVAHEDGRRTLPADGARVTPGERLLLDVVLRNRSVGHRFPGGTLDAHDTWIEVVARDADGNVIAEAGTEHAATGADPTAHSLRAALIGSDGTPLLERQTHLFRAVAWNHTIAPRDAVAVQYELSVPDGAKLPLRIEARLRHRSRNLSLAAATCAETRSPRGREFAAHAGRYEKTIDACVEQPITEIARSEVAIGVPVDAPRDWRRLYEHGLAMSHAVQERLDEARPGLEGALAILEADGGTPRQRAMVLAALANVAGRQGRTDEALALLDRAEALVPGHPALAHARGEALSAVWRWSLAVPPLAAAAEAEPDDPTLWMHLAVAAGSAGDPETALSAARRGLALQPRDPDLLRVQALSLQALGAPEEDFQLAMQEYLRRRIDDEAPSIRGRCSAHVPGCARERDPVHVHEMRAPGGATVHP